MSALILTMSSSVCWMASLVCSSLTLQSAISALKSLVCYSLAATSLLKFSMALSLAFVSFSMCSEILLLTFSSKVMTLPKASELA